MKRIVIVFVLFVFSLNAQVFNEGDNFVSLGYGIGTRYQNYFSNYQNYKGYNFSSFGPLNIQYERGFKKIGPGIIGLGGVLSYSSYKATWIQNYYYMYYSSGYLYDYEYKGKNIQLMFRGAYHYDFGIDNLDVYAGLGVGFSYEREKLKTNDPYYNSSSVSVSLGSWYRGYVFVGGRYMFTSNLGGYLEVSPGFSALNLGLTYKL